jgi:6-phosphogluconolactonase
MAVNIYHDSTKLSEAFAEWMSQHIAEVLKTKDRFTIALSGGSTPKKLYGLLAENYRDKIDWAKMHIFWGDERYVPSSDERNNAKMAYDELLNYVAVPPTQIHEMRTDIEPERSAEEYERILKEYFPGNESFDLVLLGLGDNVHTLSLFPAYPVIHEKDHWVKAFFLKEQNMFRITLTAPVVNLSHAIVYLVSGQDKADAVAHVMLGKFVPDLYPAQMIKPEHGELHWFLDEAAAMRIRGKVV